MAKLRNDIPRKYELKFRCSLLEKRAIEKMAENSGLKTAQFCRASALNQKISYKLTAEEIEVYKMLAEYRTNFKRIGNLFRKNEDITADLQQLIKEIDGHLKKLI